MAVSRFRATGTAVVAVLLAVVVLAGCGSTTAELSNRYGGPATPAATPRAGVEEAGIDTATQARADLARLPVLARRPHVAGYQRSCSPGAGCSFGPAWTDDQDSVDGHNGCSTRDDVLAAQLRDVQLRRGSRCIVSAGTLTDPYTGARIAFSKSRAYLVPIDHVVPLALAWDLGAAQWSQAQRTAYANDPALVLLAVDEQSNEQKSDSGPAEWMPADHGYWCAYDQRIVTVLTHYRLKVTQADKDAMNRVLAHC